MQRLGDAASKATTRDWLVGTTCSYISRLESGLPRQSSGRGCQTSIHQRDQYFIAEPPAPAPHLAHPRMCGPTHCASYCAPCQPLLRAFSGWIRSPPPAPVLFFLILSLPPLPSLLPLPPLSLLSPAARIFRFSLSTYLLPPRPPALGASDPSWCLRGTKCWLRSPAVPEPRSVRGSGAGLRSPAPEPRTTFIRFTWSIATLSAPLGDPCSAAPPLRRASASRHTSEGCLH